MMYKTISIVVCLLAGLSCFWLYRRFCSSDKRDLAICAGMSLLIAAFVFIILM